MTTLFTETSGVLLLTARCGRFDQHGSSDERNEPVEVGDGMTTLSTELSPAELTDIKLRILSNGISFAPGFLESYRPEFIEKRWAYGASDALHFQARIPQEILLPQVIAPIHVVENSPYQLAADGLEYFLLEHGEPITPITFPKRPRFYEASFADGTPCREVGTLYGGGSLGIFALGTCYYFSVGKQCGFCSLEPTRSIYGDHLLDIKADDSAEMTRIALEQDPDLIRQVMLNGGNRRNNDMGFRRHLETVRRVAEVVNELDRQDEVEVHLITMPPDNLELLAELKGLPVKVAMNLEVFSPSLFPVIAPGKHDLYGREKAIEAQVRAAEILGAGNIYTIFVGGLEPVDSLAEGLDYVAERGVAPVINVFHPDPGVRLADHPRASLEDLRAMGKHLQAVYQKYDFVPFYQDCGRNSLDTEAANGWFH